MYSFKVSNTILLCVCFQQFHMEFLIIHKLFMLCTTVQPRVAMRLCGKVGGWMGGAFLKNNQCFTRLHHSYVYHALCKFASNTTIFTLIPGLRAEPRVTTVKIIHVHLA